MSVGPEFLLAQLERAIPRHPFVPTVVEVAGAATCPRDALLKLIPVRLENTIQDSPSAPSRTLRSLNSAVLNPKS